MDSLSPPGRRGHVVCFPGQSQSHISAMLKLAKLVYHKGFYITFVITDSINRRMHMSQGGPSFIPPPQGFQFLTIPDHNASQNIILLLQASKTSLPASFCELIANLTANASLPNSVGSGVFPPISCIIGDALWPFTSRPAADKFGIPLILFSAISPTSFFVLKYYYAIKQSCIQQGNNKGESNETTWYLKDTPIDCIPNVENLRVCDLPRSLGMIDPNDSVLHTAIEAVEMAQKSAAIIFHTSEVLECKVLNALSSHFPRVCPIEPLHLLLNQIPIYQSHLKHIECNMWKEDATCLQWLDTKEPKSVLYVNFGSLASVKTEQLVEFAMGICNSNHPFLWIVKPDLDKGGFDNMLPPEFIKETKDRGFLSGWCPQEDVLNHPSIGGFITHCGWNSALESICAGVPMLCWPCFGDQHTTSRLIYYQWKIGLELSEFANKDEVETLVKRLMEGEESEVMRKRANKLKESITKATTPNCSSSLNLDKLLEDISSKSLPPYHMKEKMQQD